MDYQKESLKKHQIWGGKIETKVRVPLKNKEDLSLAYTPGVASSSLAIKENPELSFSLTRRGNTVAVITDGTAILGLGDIGPEAGMPVMEGKCALFKKFGDVDAIPLCLKTKDTEEIIHIIKMLSGSFGGINLEDISSPRCFEIEKRLAEELDIPVFHDDQHGTAIVVGAALLNALKILKKNIEDIGVVINGPGAAGTAITKFLLDLGVKDILVCGINGILSPDENLAPSQKELALLTNKKLIKGNLEKALVGKDVFIGVSVGGCLKKEMIKGMKERPVIFALANPTPEIDPFEAKQAGAFIIGTGSSLYPNQINNALVFPGLFKGALQAQAKKINKEMKLAAAYALSSYIKEKDLTPEYLLPSPLDKKVYKAVAKAVFAAAIRTHVTRG